MDLPLRAPMYLLSGESSGGEWSENGTMSSSDRMMDWIYPTKKLLSGSVQYHVFYLGEREVTYLLVNPTPAWSIRCI